MIKIATIALIIFYNLTLLAGTAYLVQVFDWSPWWFFFTVLVLANYKKEDYERHADKVPQGKEG